MLGQIYSYVEWRLKAAIYRFRSVRDRDVVSWSVPLERVIETAPLTGDDHWARATGVITAAISGLERVQGFQLSAARQVDAAEYALQHLLEELSAAMPLPADGAPLRAVLAEAARTPRAAAGKALAA